MIKSLFLPLLAWLGGLALECAGLPLLELGWALLGCSGACGSTGGQGASCWGAGVHFYCGSLVAEDIFDKVSLTVHCFMLPLR